MNPPPLASPFGASPPPPKLRKVAPVWLKVLIGVQLLHSSVRVVSDGILAHADPSAYVRFWWSDFIAYLLVTLVWIGLWRGSKICWWLTVGGAFYTLVRVVGRSFLHSKLPHDPFPEVFPRPILYLFAAMGWALLIYLLTPAARRFFFSPRGAPRADLPN